MGEQGVQEGDTSSLQGGASGWEVGFLDHATLRPGIEPLFGYSIICCPFQGEIGRGKFAALA